MRNMAVLLITICVLSMPLMISTASQCFNPGQSKENCIRQLGFRNIETRRGYEFGFGSLNETEYMCKTKWHIKVVDCMHQESQANCMREEEQYQRLLWDISLKSERFSKAANYLCSEHNMKIFQAHKSGCLQRNEKRAEKCSIIKQHVTRKGLSLLNSPTNAPSDKNQYYNYAAKVRDQFECKGLTALLDCLYQTLQSECSANAIKLVMRYFMETRPRNCDHDQEQKLASYRSMLDKQNNKATSSSSQSLDRSGKETKLFDSFSSPVKDSRNVGVEALQFPLTIFLIITSIALMLFDI